MSRRLAAVSLTLSFILGCAAALTGCGEHVGPGTPTDAPLPESAVRARKAAGYRPWEHVQREPALESALKRLVSGELSNGDRELFRPLVDNLMHQDPYLVCADFAAYVACQDAVDQRWQDPAGWTRSAIYNTARSGKFSSDRSIRDYAERIWQVEPYPVSVERAPVE